jgi:hypothetical protein
VFCNHSSIHPKQIRYFLLGEPNRFVLEIYFYFHLAIGRGVEQNFAKALLWIGFHELVLFIIKVIFDLLFI